MAVIPPEFVPFAAAVLVFAGFVKGTTGFGITLITVPLLSMAFPPRQAILLMTLPVLIVNFTTAAITIREWREIRRILLLFPVGAAFVPVGVWLLLWVPADVMRAAIGAAILFVVTMRFTGWSALHLREQGRRCFAAGMGAAAGFMGGALMLPMPPIVFYLNATKVPREAFVFLLNLLASALVLGQVLSFAWMGLYDGGAWRDSLVMLIPALAGLAAGTRLRQRFSQGFFERLVLGLLGTTGAVLLVRLAVRWL